MSFALLAPLGLAALIALALPIAIHLVRRIELRTTDFAALRWISERIRPRRRIRFERPWLLLLRLALLALFAVLLARPIMNESAIANGAFVVVAPGVDASAAREAVSASTADWRWLAPGFPPFASTSSSNAVPTMSLLRELDAELPSATKLSVIVPAELSGLDGERPKLSRAIDWHVVPGRMPASEAADASQTIRLAVRYAPSSEPALKYLRAAAAALNTQGTARYELDAAPADAAIDASAHTLIWLGSEIPQTIAAWIEAGGTALVDHQSKTDGVPVWRDADGAVIARVQTRGRGRLIALAGELSPTTFPALLDADFPSRLRDLVQAPPAAPTRAQAEAMQPEQGASAANVAAMPSSTKPLDPWLALLIAALFAIERFVATRRREPA